ncbi:hypothetical protein CVT24_000109 [Panaeolus cyanescens]|uniref:Uncharacterized protein n=1 Tax=Panaeolus cyanescens TaxID=181874 RepID=A0A409W7L3_9AGAR|nr:hypothetical protein CVT24_000109 [Panaeolus cyanescens]
MSLFKPGSLSSHPLNLFFSHEKHIPNSSFVIPRIVISPPDESEDKNKKFNAKNTVTFGNRSEEYLGSTKSSVATRSISSLAVMPQLLKAPQPLRPVIVKVPSVAVIAMEVEAEIVGCIENLSAMMNADSASKEVQGVKQDHDEHQPRICQDNGLDDRLKGEFESYVSKAGSNRQTELTPSDTIEPVFTIPVFNPSPSSTPPPKSADTWEPKTVVIDVDKLMQPPASVSPFRYCAMMMNAEIVATENGSNVVGSDENDALDEFLLAAEV